MNKIPVLITLLVVISSACIATGKTGGSGELTINAFYFNPDAMHAGQKTFLNLEIQNGGTFPARNTTVVLYGMNADIQLSNKLVSAQEVPSNNSVHQKNLSFGSIDPPSEALQSGGEKRSVKWLVSFTGDALRGQSLKQKANVRACYNYKTEANGELDFITATEYLLQKEKGSITEGSVRLQSTTGPLSLSIEAPTPIILNDTNHAEFPLKVDIANVGSGFAVGTDSSPCVAFNASQANQATLSVVPKNEGEPLFITCKVDRDNTKQSINIFLKRGDTKSQTFYCEYHAPSGVPVATEEIRFLLDYGYYVDAEATLMIKGA